MKKYIILMDTLLSGVVPAYTDSDDMPIVYDTQQEAEENMLDDHLFILETHIREFKEGKRPFHDVDVTCGEWVEQCEIDDQGIVTLQDGTIINPKD